MAGFEISGEEFLPVPGYEAFYGISKSGKIWSHRKKRLLKPGVSDQGYYIVNLRDEVKVTWHKVHRLIALVYIPNLLSKPFINHIDANRANNSLSNLEWCTPEENVHHALSLGNKPGVKKGSINEKCKHSKPVDQFDLQGNLIKTWPSGAEASRNGFHQAVVNRCCRGVSGSKTYKGFIWKFH